MNDQEIELPKFYDSIQKRSNEINFSMPSDLQTGCLLRTLVASKPTGCFLELGTGTGLSLSWIVETMSENSHVYSIDNSEIYLSIAKQYFSNDNRITIICEDATKWIKDNQDKKFDLIFADAWPGKYETLEETLSMLNLGGIYLIDDMLPQSNWPEGHKEHVNDLLNYLACRPDFKMTKMNWSTGIVILCKIIN